MRFFLSFIFFLISFSAVAKSPQFVVRSKVILADTSAFVPLGDVFVNLSAIGDTVPVKYKLLTGNDSTKITDETGELRLLVDGGRGRYMLSLDKEGYEPLMKEFEVKFRNQNVIWLGNLSMHKTRINELEELVVKGTAVKLVVKGDTMVYNADAFKLADGSTLDALIKQLDGVEIDEDGQITVNGRAIKSLLLNGKDFFKGDPSVALENLPAFAVKNLRVYDKAAEDDYLTKSSAKLARKEDEENLVMDVTLKKEINITGTGTIEGGYGTADRWLGKAFGLGNTDKVRLSAFVNANNIKDTESGGNHNRIRVGNGETTLETTGLDYMYDNDKTRVNGNVNYRMTDQSVLNETASTRYYQTGDIFRRSASNSVTRSHSLSTSHWLHQKWEAVYFGAHGYLNWDKKNYHTVNREASFNKAPEEDSRTEALDSVFARPFSKRYNDILLSRLSTATREGSDALSTGADVNATIRTTEMQGRVSVDASGSYSKNHKDSRTVFLQKFGGANADPSAVPTNSDRFSNGHGNSFRVSFGSNYNRDWSFITNDAWQNRLSLSSRISYSYNYNHGDYDLFTAAPESDQVVLPSLSCPEHALQDLADSYNSDKKEHYGDARVTLGYNREMINPSAEGFNPSFYVFGSLTYWLKNEDLDYHVLEYTQPEYLNRTKGHVSSSVNFGLNSGNDNRYMNIWFNYNNSTSDPSLNLFLKTRTNTNPLQIYLNNAENLNPSVTNNISLGLYRQGRKLHNYLNARLNWSRTKNSIGYWSQYNPNTGVTTHRPMNIDGNWSASGNVNYNHPFGKREQFTPSIWFGTSYTHSVDFQSTTDVPLRQAVDNYGVNGGLNLNYKFSNGSNISIGGGPRWTYATSERERFNTVDAMNYTAHVNAVIELPANIQIRTNLNFEARRGYEEKAMNTDQWLWNATISKSIMKGKFTFKLTAVDILGQIDPVRLTVNAQGRTETWTNTLPRYVMFTAQWRINGGFGKQGKQGRQGRHGGVRHF